MTADFVPTLHLILCPAQSIELFLASAAPDSAREMQ